MSVRDAERSMHCPCAPCVARTPLAQHRDSVPARQGAPNWDGAGHRTGPDRRSDTPSGCFQRHPSTQRLRFQRAKHAYVSASAPSPPSTGHGLGATQARCGSMGRAQCGERADTRSSRRWGERVSTPRHGGLVGLGWSRVELAEGFYGNAHLRVRLGSS